jgi:zinc protease
MMSIFLIFRPFLLIGLFLSTLLSSFLLFDSDRIQAAVPAATQSESATLTAGVKQTVLSNGLTVLTKEVHTAPVVSVQVWYRVGSRNEGKGINGLSHQLEHLMFKGTKERPIQFGRLFSALGSESNAFTSYDETAYYGTVERDKLDALLVLEADRMHNAINSADYLASEKKVVISELQGYENSPGYRLGRAVMRSAFPDRTYGLPVGGTKADVEKFTVDQVQQYYRTYYRPDNATLVVTGDFDTKTVLDRVKQIYGPIPKPAQPLLSKPAQGLGVLLKQAPPSAPIVLKEPGSTPLLSIVYPLPDANHPDVPAIDVMDAILTEGRSSRLYQALVESGLASSVSASASEPIEPGWYNISATPAAGQSPAQVEKTLQQTLNAFRQQPVSAEELERAKTQLQASFIFGNQDITSQANQLGFSQTVTGDYRFTDRYLAGIKRVTAADVQQAARTYLKPEAQTVGFFEPTLADGKPGTSSASAGKTSENFSPGTPVDPAQVAKYLPAMQASNQSMSAARLPQSFTLTNGLKVLLLSDHSIPTVNLGGHIQAGSIFDTPDRAGLAGLTAGNLMNGTTTKDALTLAKTLEDRGAGLGFGASRAGVSISGNALAQDLPILIQTLADVVQNATFPVQQLELSRQRSLIGLKAALDDPRQLGRRAFQQAIYPANHPFYSFPTEDSLKQITRQELVQFYQQHYRPDGTVLALVGDFEPAQLQSLLEKSLGQWKGTGQPSVPTFPTVMLPKATTYFSKSIPGKAESVTYLGYNSISRKDPRFYAALVMNQVLGGSTLSSRLGTEVRDRQGLTYGIYSGFSAGVYPGPFLISMQTAPENAQTAVNSTVALLKQLKETGITQAELDEAKRSITSSYPVGLASPSDLVDVILGNEVMGLSPEELRQFPAKVEAVTPAQLKQAISELIQPNNLVIVTAGPPEKVVK